MGRNDLAFEVAISNEAIPNFLLEGFYFFSSV